MFQNMAILHETCSYSGNQSGHLIYTHKNEKKMEKHMLQQKNLMKIEQ